VCPTCSAALVAGGATTRATSCADAPAWSNPRRFGTTGWVAATVVAGNLFGACLTSDVYGAPPDDRDVGGGDVINDGMTDDDIIDVDETAEPEPEPEPDSDDETEPSEEPSASEPDV